MTFEKRGFTLRPQNPTTLDLPELRTPVPARALGYSLLALGVAAVAALLWPDSLQEFTALIWLLALVPSFLFAYYRGWQGAAFGLTAAMGLLLLIEVLPRLLTGTQVDWRIPGIIAVVFIAASLGAGWIAEMMRRTQLRALHLAYADALTGLPNRRVLKFFLERHFAAAQRGSRLAVVLFDIDEFKAYNDRFGHGAGDEALRAFAGVLGESSRKSDLCGRYGGEEFLAVLPGADLKGAGVFAERVRSRLEDTELATGARITVSGGIACYAPTLVTPADFVSAADSALYLAKNQGRNRIEPAPRESPAGGTARTGTAGD